MTREKVFEQIEEAAIYGDSEAQYELALAYFDGYGVEQDEKQAIKWLEIAAWHRNPDALFELAHIFVEGHIIEKDIRRALSLYQKILDEFCHNPSWAGIPTEQYLFADNMVEELSKELRKQNSL